MKNKIKNWLEKHEYIYGVGMLCVSVSMLAFGGAYLGASTALSNTTTVVNLVGPDSVTELVTE